MPTFEVGAGEAGCRLDGFLSARGVVASVAAARRFIAEGGVRVDGRTARKGEHLAVGQVVEVPAAVETTVAPEPERALRVIHEDEALVAVDKPAGVPSHPLRAGERGTLAGALVARFPECATASPDPREAGFAHRLDVGTSGLLVAARRSEIWERLRVSLGGGACEKIYLAEVVGALPDRADHAPLVIDAAIGRRGRHGSRVKIGGGRGVLDAHTEVQVRERREGTTLVSATLQRGRAHQVRVHLAHLGFPVVGDQVYGEARNGEGFRLHAWRLRFVHPVTGVPLVLEAPPPVWARSTR